MCTVLPVTVLAMVAVVLLMVEGDAREGCDKELGVVSYVLGVHFHSSHPPIFVIAVPTFVVQFAFHRRSFSV